jgi:hypothetical protein
VIASSLSTIVVAVVLTTFVGSAREGVTCTKIVWSQKEAMLTSAKLTMYIRNASAISAIDESEGTWLELEFPDGSATRLVYSNAVPELRDGRLLLQKTNSTEVIVARGLTEIQSPEGFTMPVFSSVRHNHVRVAYRVSEPVRSGGRETDDGVYAACVSFSVCLRNTGE